MYESLIQPPAAPAGAGSTTTGGADNSLFDSLLWQESRGKQLRDDGTPVTSKKGAIGIAQVMPGTAPEAAKLAGLEYDDFRYRTDADYNKALGRAYFNKQLEDFGDESQALAAYNAGPAAMRRALESAQRAGTPDQWLRFLPAETQAYVPSILAKAGRVPGVKVPASASAGGQRTPVAEAASEFFTPSRGEYASLITPPLPERSTLESAKDSAVALGSGLAAGVSALASVAGADNVVARGADQLAKDIEDQASPYRKEQRARRAAMIQAAEDSGSTWGEIVANAGAFAEAPFDTLLNAVGSSAPTLLLAAVPGLGQAGAVRFIAQGAMGAAQGAGAVKGSIYEAVQNEMVKQGMSPSEAAKVAAGAQAYDSANQSQIAIGGLLGLLAGTTGAEASVARIAGGAGPAAAARGAAAKVGGGVVKEGVTEAAQGGQERLASNVALQNEGVDVPTWKGVAGQATIEGLAGGVMGGGFAGVEAATERHPAVPAQLQPVAEAASKPNSPASRAAMAGNTPEAVAARATQEQAAAAQDQATEAKPDPAARLAELEAIARGTPDAQGPDGQAVPGTPSRFFTAEEKAEYDQLVGLRDATQQVVQGGQPQRDQISERVTAIETQMRDGAVLDQLRAEGADTKGLIKDLAIAKSPSTGAAQREQALARVEYTLGWAGTAQPAATTAPGDPIAAALTNHQVSSADHQALLAARGAMDNPALPQATRDASRAQALEIAGRYAAPAAAPGAADAAGPAAPAVLGDIPPTPGSPAEAIREAERFERGAQQFAEAGFETDAVPLQEQADSLREEAATRRAAEVEAARVEDVPAPAVRTTPPGSGSAYTRRRRATLDQLVADGLDRVERRDDGMYLVSQNGKRQHKLENVLDAQMARAAIAAAIKAGADKANPNPTQAQKEAGNYKVGEVKFDGLTLAIENPQGSERSGVDPNGERWTTVMPANYGYVRGSAQAADGDKVDIYLPNTARAGSPAWIIDQYNDDGSFDETKTVLGVATEEEAARIYDAGFSDGSGPRRRGAITSMPMDEFNDWVMSPAAKKPAGAKPVTETERLAADMQAEEDAAPADTAEEIRIRFDGKPLTLARVDPAKLGRSSKPVPGGNAKTVTKSQAKMLQAVADVFGKQVVFFSTDVALGDGFVRPGDSSTIYLNAASAISPMAVFGHELTHLLEAENAEAHAALMKVVAARLKKGAEKSYAKLGYRDGEILQEITSDLSGDLMTDPKFWSEVFDEVRTDSAVAALIAAVRHYVAKLVAAISQPGFGSEKLVSDLDSIRAALRTAMATYARQAQAGGLAKMQAQALRAEQEIRRAEATRSASREAPAASASVDSGIHFSKQPRERLDGRFYGTGMKGAEARRLAASSDPRIRERVYAYLDGREPESGVGGFAHNVDLRDLYDADDDALNLWNPADLNASESAILDAGFSGYKSKGVGVVLGDASHNVVARPINGTAAEEVFRKGLMSAEIKQIIVGNIPGATMRSGSLVVPARSREQANTELARIGSSIRFSRERLNTARAEFEAVEKKLRGTDGWMKGPTGAATKLNERQWVQVRTPSFKRWFGDWEAAHAAGGVWSVDNVSKAVDRETGEPMVVYHGSGMAGFAEFERPGGTKRGDLGIFVTDNRFMAESYARRGRPRTVEEGDLDTVDDDGDVQQAERFGGVYGLFINVRNPNEDNFEGANWDGSRENQWIVEAAGEQQFDEDTGRGHFSKEEALERAEAFVNPDDPDDEAGNYIRGADEHWNTTDGVVREARNSGNDGAIIREVMDDGGGPSRYAGEPSDIFVAFDPNQVKSADFNDGTYSASEDDIRRSRAREIPESVDDVTNVDAAFQFAGSRQFGTNREFKMALQQRAEDAAAAGRVALDQQDERTERYLVRVGARDARIGLRDNSNAVGWYNDKVTKALRLVSLVHPEVRTSPEARFAFTWALAVTSNGQKVGKNFEMAEEAYEAYRRQGKMPTDIKGGQAQQAINDGMRLFNELRDAWGLQELMRFATARAKVRDIERATGIPVGGEGKDTEVYGAAILGPKIGNGFFMNLYGQFDQLTMDRWLMRTWGRWTGTLVDVDRSKVKAKRDQLGAVLRMLSAEQKKAFEEATGEKLRLSDLDAAAVAIQQASVKPDRRERMNRVAPLEDRHAERLDEVLGATRKGQKRDSLGGELRKLGNTLARLLDGQVEAPNGVRQRDFIRSVFSGILGQLQSEYRDLTMADLQAVLWYPEKKLYDAAKASDAADTSYSDDEAPDYANAASALAARKGVPAALISKTIKDVENELETAKRAGAAGRGVGQPGADRDPAGLEDVAPIRSAVRDPRGIRGSDVEVALDSRPQPRDRGTDLAGLPAEVKVDGRLIRFGGYKPAQDAARAYTQKAGIDYQPPTTYAKVDPARAKRIADAFEAMPHAPNDPEVKAAYRALVDETAAQYQAMLDTGLVVEFIDGPDPYGNPRNAILDVTRNNHLWVYPTTEGFGGSASADVDITGNPLLEPTKFKISGRTALANDLFRAVHDYFGHIAEGVGFRADGEENTWRKHAAMFTPLARRALTTETRGQNSWVNYGPFAEHNKTANGGDTQYAPQKIGLLPEWVVEEGRTDAPLDRDAINERIDVLEDLIACLKK